MALKQALTAPELDLLEVAHRTVAEKWRPFLQKHGSTLVKNHGWELRFFSDVLSQVSSLRPEHVSPQHPFQDMKGGRRYIDFAIRIDERRLAVEVDGFDKTGGGGPTPETHIDFTERQNALSLQGWTVLRFTNRQFSRDPTTCIQHLEMTVRDMVESSAQSREALKSYLQGLESEIRVKAAAAQGQDRAMYEEQQKDLEALLASTSSRLESLNQRNNTMGKALLAVAILVATAAYTLVQSMEKGAAVVAAPARAPPRDAQHRRLAAAPVRSVIACR
jgi:very-short-patch-repair endonuclease